MSDQQQFKSGDEVILKDGDTPMVVRELEGDDVHVTWQVKGKVFNETFHRSLLLPYDPLDRLPIVI